jgi:hypothetical protein
MEMTFSTMIVMLESVGARLQGLHAEFYLS